MVDQMAIQIKNNDKDNRNEHMEMDEYVSRLEVQIEHYEDQIEAQDQHIANLEEVNEEL